MWALFQADFFSVLTESCACSTLVICRVTIALNTAQDFRRLQRVARGAQ